MRLWTVHPKYLDARGLVALWREALLAQKVLEGRTKGYTRHPQLLRFRNRARPLAVIAAYLVVIHEEATRRGYKFDAKKIRTKPFRGRVKETKGQLLCEWSHLLGKLKARDLKCHRNCCKIQQPECHPLFTLIAGEVREWEKTRRKQPRSD